MLRDATTRDLATTDVPVADAALGGEVRVPTLKGRALARTWRELLDAGVAAVSLHEHDRRVYGPMGLSPQ